MISTVTTVGKFHYVLPGLFSQERKETVKKCP